VFVHPGVEAIGTGTAGSIDGFVQIAYDTAIDKCDQLGDGAPTTGQPDAPIAEAASATPANPRFTG
jgi:hypothetical protein